MPTFIQIHLGAQCGPFSAGLEGENKPLYDRRLIVGGFGDICQV